MRIINAYDSVLVPRNALIYVVDGVSVAERSEAHEPLVSDVLYLRVLAALVDYEAHLVKVIEELIDVDRRSYRLVDGFTDLSPQRRSAFLFCEPFAVVLAFALRLLDDGQAVLAAQPVRFLAHLLIVLMTVPKLSAVKHRRGADNKVIVKMTCITMGGDQNTIGRTPKISCKLLTYFVGSVRIDFACGKRLIGMIAYTVSFVFVSLQIVLEPLGGVASVTVYA